MSEEIYEEADRWYGEAHNTYKLICEQVKGNLERALGGRGVHDIQCRAKDIESFSRKSRKSDDTGSIKYTDPVNQIEDLAAVRIIVFLKEDVEIVSSKINELYDVKEEGDVSARASDQSKFGYESRHLILQLDKRQYFGKKKRPDAVKCEIQVRTILQHAWAEMEHDIGYKTDRDIPPELRRRFSALAGLLEIADTEFSRIQHDSLELRSKVKKELVAEITREMLGDNSRAKDRTLGKNVRDLISERKYEEAIQRYTGKIEIEPRNLTQYIGRAKAHFLNGETRKAIEDIDKAEEIGGAMDVTLRLRSLFTSGELSTLEREISASAKGNHADLLMKANVALASGNGVEAFDMFCELQERGYSRPFSILGKAMSQVLENDPEGAEVTLADLRIIPATPMKVAVAAMYQIIFVERGQKGKASLSRIKEAVAECPDFAFDKSPLRYLLAGFEKSGKLEGEINIIFQSISGVAAG